MNPKVTLARRAYFSAGIVLRNPQWDQARNQAVFGILAGPHGHDYGVNVFYSGQISRRDGMIVNLVDIKPVLARVLETLDGKFLSQEVEFFADHRPTAANIVNFIWQAMPVALGEGRLDRIELEESARLSVVKTQTNMRLTRSYEFSAAHRLDAPQLSTGENQSLYGKCNNLTGHGHNYRLEVTVEGEPDAQTGAIVDLKWLDGIVDEEVYAPFDHHHLNVDCADFESLIPTSENLARVIFERLHRRLQESKVSLVKVGLHETSKNYFEVEA